MNNVTPLVQPDPMAFYTTLAIFFVIMAGIGWYASTKTKSLSDFLVMGDRRLTFRDAERQSAELAKGLLALGIGKAARVGLLMPNEPDWVLNYFALARVGALTVTLSTFYQASEISWGVRFNDLDTLIISASYLKNDYIERLERAIPGLADQTSTELHLPTHPYLRRIIVSHGDPIVSDPRGALRKLAASLD